MIFKVWIIFNEILCNIWYLIFDNVWLGVIIIELLVWILIGLIFFMLYIMMVLLFLLCIILYLIFLKFVIDFFNKYCVVGL